MRRMNSVTAAIAFAAIGSLVAFAQAPQQPAPAGQAPAAGRSRRRRTPGRPRRRTRRNNPTSFFVTSVGKGDGANYGGLAGADAYCAERAKAANLPTPQGRTWRAYLSATAQGGQPAVNARDRIGAGPWHNARGTLIANNVADLHGDVERDRNQINKNNALNETGDADQRRRRHAEPARHHHRFGLTRARTRERNGGHDLQQLHEQSGSAGGHRARPGAGRLARSPRSHRRRQHVVECRAQVGRLQPAGAGRDRRRGIAVLLRGELKRGRPEGRPYRSRAPTRSGYSSVSSSCQSASGCGPSLMCAMSGSSPSDDEGPA